MDTLVGMQKKTDHGKESPIPKKDRHKPSYQCRIPGIFVEPLEKLAKLNGGDIPDEIRTAIREYLQKQRLWPRSISDGS